jgi:ribosomal protein L13
MFSQLYWIAQHNNERYDMSENTVVEVASAEAVKVSGKKRDLVKIGRHLARQIRRQGISEMSLEAVMEAKRVDRVQGKAVIRHCEKLLEQRGIVSPFATV